MINHQKKPPLGTDQMQLILAFLLSGLACKLFTYLQFPIESTLQVGQNEYNAQVKLKRGMSSARYKPKPSLHRVLY